MQYGISTASLYPMPTEDVLKLFAQRRIPYCEIFFNTVSELSPNSVSYTHLLKAVALAAVSPYFFLRTNKTPSVPSPQ